MKKRIALYLTICMAAGAVFAGCAAPEPEEEASAAQTETAEGETEATEEAAFEGETADYKIALMIPGTLGDKSFFDAAFNAVGMLEEEYGMQVDYVEAGADASKYYPTYVDLCEGGYDLILTISTSGDDALVQVAEEFPEQKFINLDGMMDEIPENLYIIYPENNEMSFLAGAVAALKAEELGESTIGFVGGMDIPGINEFLAGYIEGAQQINPDIKVSTSYVGNFTDTAKGKENGLLLYDSGISVVFAAAGQSGLGVMDAAVQKGKFVIGVDTDQAEALKDSQPEMAEVIITSAIKNIPETALYIVDKAMKGEVVYGTRDWYGLAENVVGIAENEFYEKLMTDEARQRVEELKEAVISGDLKVTETKGMTTEELIEIRESVRP